MPRHLTPLSDYANIEKNSEQLQIFLVKLLNDNFLNNFSLTLKKAPVELQVSVADNTSNELNFDDNVELKVNSSHSLSWILNNNSELYTLDFKTSLLFDSMPNFLKESIRKRASHIEDLDNTLWAISDIQIENGLIKFKLFCSELEFNVSAQEKN